MCFSWLVLGLKGVAPQSPERRKLDVVTSLPIRCFLHPGAGFVVGVLVPKSEEVEACAWVSFNLQCQLTGIA